ncbi:hypothetical protein [Microcoleus sp. S13_B4]|uniref:hypothetical protein n=1 Tax=Microcoleus sp. S13_B4 TaxID=3055408 RepID=UPI002FD262C6
MIISDLNHVEVVSEETSIVGGYTPSESSSVYFSEYFNLNKYISSAASVFGHTATVESDAKAFGNGTVTQTFTKTLTTPYSSSSSGTSISATGGSFWYF